MWLRWSVGRGAIPLRTLRPGSAQDELRYMWRHHLFQNLTDDTSPSATTSIRKPCPWPARSFLLGTGVGSGGVHWNGQIWRFLPTDFLTKSHNQQRYGKKAVSDYDLTVQDWVSPMTSSNLSMINSTSCAARAARRAT